MSLATQQLLKRMKLAFPDLSKRTKKGENGRIAVVGGSFEFTGAPFYSAISALKVGGDLSHIFCSKFSSPAIKSYSPEIIVHPVFVSEEEVRYSQRESEEMTLEWANKLKGWEKAINSWIIGPGLGRDRYMQEFLPLLIKNLPNDSIVIFDADGIYYLCHYPHLFDELSRFKTILTPNYRELAILQRLYKIDIEEILNKYSSGEEITEFPTSYAFPHFKLLVKGTQDIVIGKDRSFIVRSEGGKKRCGGMGDILAGVASVTSLWDYEYGPALASRIVRLATRAAYEKEGRGLTAPSVIKELSQVVKNIEGDIY